MIPAFINRWLPTEEKKRARLFAAAAFVSGLMLSPVSNFTINGTLASLQERATFPMIEQRIGWTRDALQYVPCGVEAVPYQSLIAEAVLWNVRIVHEKEANRHWYSDRFSTDRWNDLSVIVLPCGLDSVQK